MEPHAVETSYARWAHIYDHSFGALTRAGRRHAVDVINTRPGRVLEVGVGTGLALEFYRRDAAVTGIDFSADMLSKAQEKVDRQGLDHVEGLHRMDARALDFPDDHFDSVVAMHVMSVVPEPRRVMSEIARVCRPGGQVVITNHFMQDKGVMARIEKLSAPLSNALGWHPDFPIETVLQEPCLSVRERRTIPPLGMMTLLVMSKDQAQAA